MPRYRRSSSQTLTVLMALLEQPQQWQYGYELSKSTRLKSGTLYPILMRLSDQGFLHSRWKDAEQVGRPPRHVYRLSASGTAFARQEQENASALEVPRRLSKVGAR
jgi:PadR family transcriptional regulator, regulatory protein PadR